MLIEMILVAPFYIMLKRPSFSVNPKTIAAVVGVSFLFIGISLAFITASFHTVMSHAYLFANVCGCFKLLFVLITCKATHILERSGLLLAALGIIIMVIDPSAMKDGQSIDIRVDLMTLLINIPWMGYFALLDYLKKNMDLGLQIFLMTLLSFLISMLIAITYEGVNFDVSDNGIWGFF